MYIENGRLIADDRNISVNITENGDDLMKTRLKFQVDKDLLLAIVVGVCGSLVALAMFFLSGYMVTQSALGAPL